MFTNYSLPCYLQCEHPMSIVPKFSLFREHRCPDPKPQLYEAPVNVVVRHQQRLYGVPYGGETLYIGHISILMVILC